MGKESRARSRSWSIDRGWLTATARAAGPRVDPLIARPREVARPLEERKVGGRGVHLARTLTDGIRYYHEAGQNVLTVRKKLGALVRTPS